MSHFFPSHDPSVILYLVPHFSEVWKCGKVWQSKDIVALSPSHEPFVILYLVLHFSEVWKCGKVWQSQDNVTLFPLLRTPCHSLLSSTLLRGVEVWNSLTESGYCRTFPQSRIPWHSFLSYTPMYEMRIKRSGTVSWFYFCNSFYIFLNAIFTFRQRFCD